LRIIKKPVKLTQKRTRKINHTKNYQAHFLGNKKALGDGLAQGLKVGGVIDANLVT
jgi:hypothetical protein